MSFIKTLCLSQHFFCFWSNSTMDLLLEHFIKLIKVDYHVNHKNIVFIIDKYNIISL